MSCAVNVQLEKVKTLMSRAKYGCASASNPINALQRDSDVNDDTSYDDASVRAMYSDQLTQLENLITRQHDCQQQMRDQLIAVEKQYHSVSCLPRCSNMSNICPAFLPSDSVVMTIIARRCVVLVGDTMHYSLDCFHGWADRCHQILFGTPVEVDKICCHWTTVLDMAQKCHWRSDLLWYVVHKARDEAQNWFCWRLNGLPQHYTHACWYRIGFVIHFLGSLNLSICLIDFWSSSLLREIILTLTHEVSK